MMGIAGYMAFMDKVDDNIIYSFHSDDFWSFVTLFKLAVVLHLCFFIPLEFVIMRKSFNTLLQWNDGDISYEAHLISSIGLLLTALGTGIL